MKKVNCQDEIELVSVTDDGFGDRILDVLVKVHGAFLLGMSQNSSGDVDVLDTDAHCYLDPDHEFIKENHYRLEGMYLKAPSPFDREKEDWYKIEKTKIGHRKLTTNTVNNVHVFLSKCENPYIKD